MSQIDEDRINNVYKPTPSDIPPKAVNAFAQGTSPESVGAGQGVNNVVMVDGYWQSKDYVPGVSGWRIDPNEVEFGSGKFRGKISASTIEIGTNAWHVDINGNMWWGNFSTYAAATIKISAAGVANLSGLTVGTNVGLGTAQDSSGVTTIIGNIVTTGYVNALSIVAGSVNANNVTAGTIVGSSIYSSNSAGKIKLAIDNILYFEDSTGADQGKLYTTISDFNVWAKDDVNILVSGGSLAMAFDVNYGKPNDDGHYTLGKNDGHGLLRVYAYHFSDPSDRRFKKNIKTIDSALDKVLKLRGVSFNWKKSVGIEKDQIGMIAQEVKKIVPEVVEGGVGKERYSVCYGKIVGLLIEAIKDQQTQINRLNKLIEKI